MTFAGFPDESIQTFTASIQSPAPSTCILLRARPQSGRDMPESSARHRLWQGRKGRLCVPRRNGISLRSGPLAALARPRLPWAFRRGRSPMYGRSERKFLHSAVPPPPAASFWLPWVIPPVPAALLPPVLALPALLRRSWAGRRPPPQSGRPPLFPRPAYLRSGPPSGIHK